MAINIKFDLAGNPEPPTIILATRNGNKLGQLDVNTESIELVDRLNDASEFTFTLNKYINGEIVNLWDKVVNFKLVYCKEWDTWFEITVELDEETETVKTVFCTQLGQAELSQIMLYNIEINTEEDIARDDYKITILYDNTNTNTDASLLHRLLKDKASHYSIAHVDSTLVGIQRMFSFDDISIYDAFQEIAEEIGCLFVLGSNSDENGMPLRTISVYDLYQNCLNDDCKHRGEFTDICPECGNTNIKYGYGEDTLIFVTSDELASNGIQFTTDTGAVKNCFKLEAGDDLMTATIRNCNPNGSDYIWYFSDDVKEDMSDALVEGIESYDKKYKQYYNDYESNLNENLVTAYNNLVDKYSIYNKDLKKIELPIIGYSSLMKVYYDVIDLGLYLKSSLMPTVKMEKTNAEEQGSSLVGNLPLFIAVANLKSVSKATADSSVLAMAKAIVDSSYKVTISSSRLEDNNWSGNFVITNYSDEEDTYTTLSVGCELTNSSEIYIKQKIDKLLSKENTDDLSITGLFKKSMDGHVVHDEWDSSNCECDFCSELRKYALNPLTVFHDACQACIDILIEQGVGNKEQDNTWSDSDNGSESNLYEVLYKPYYDKLIAIESEMKVREDEVNIIYGIYDADGKLAADGIKTNIENCRSNIQNELDFKGSLDKIDTNLWNEFCSYRREDKYSNNNYISDGLDNVELFKRASEFIEVAENEIFKSAEQQHSISATLNNLLAIDKFKLLADSFEVGNWIRVRVDDKLYKLRLLEYNIDFSNFDNISVVFSDVTKIKNGITDVEDILNQASSMVTSYGSVQHQANQGSNAQNMIGQWISDGLNSALVQIQNNDSEEIIIDRNGLLGRSYSDITGSYSPKQIKLTHNIIAYTSDNWESVRLAIGEHDYRRYSSEGNEFVKETGYGINADFVIAGVVGGSQIIGGDIYSDNYGFKDELVIDDKGKPVLDENGEETYISKQQGSYLNLRTGEFDFGGGALRFEINKDTGKGKLIIGGKDANGNITEIDEEWLRTTNITAENLRVNAAHVRGKLEAAEIDAGKITSGSIKSLSEYINKDGDIEPISFIDLETGEFSFGEGGLTYNGETLAASMNITASNIYGSKFMSSDGNAWIEMGVGQSGVIGNQHALLLQGYGFTGNNSIFGVYNGDTRFTSFYAKGYNFLTTDGNGISQCSGTWDFSNATTEGIYLTFS